MLRGAAASAFYAGTTMVVNTSHMLAATCGFTIRAHCLRDPADRWERMSAVQQDVRAPVAIVTLPNSDLAPCCVTSAKECPRAAA